MAAVSSAKLFAALQENAELLAAIREAESDENGTLDLTAVAETLQKGRQTEILQRKTGLDDTETLETIRETLLSAAAVVVENILASGTSGDQRVTLPYGSGKIEFVYKGDA